jgi:hypothetical protein
MSVGFSGFHIECATYFEQTDRNQTLEDRFTVLGRWGFRLEN